MEGKFVLILLVLIIIGASIRGYSLYYVTKYQMNHAKTIHDCGFFEKYEVKNKSRSGKVDVFITYIYIKANSGKNFKFQYQGRLHKKMQYIETGLKPGQKLCFDYFPPFFKKSFGETFLKSIQIEGEV